MPRPASETLWTQGIKRCNNKPPLIRLLRPYPRYFSVTNRHNEMSDLTARLRSAVAGRYKIERELAVGGMAMVFLARDLKHDRNVAIKVLHPDLAAVIGVDRFTREIRITASLGHPNILPFNHVDARCPASRDDAPPHQVSVGDFSRRFGLRLSLLLNPPWRCSLFDHADTTCWALADPLLRLLRARPTRAVCPGTDGATRRSLRPWRSGHDSLRDGRQRGHDAVPGAPCSRHGDWHQGCRRSTTSSE